MGDDGETGAEGGELKINFSKPSSVSQEQIHELLFSDKLSWHAIIYDLINTEQLNPWDLDLVLLSNKYLEKIKLLEEANFFVSSKVLLAASLLLRIKSEILLNHYLPSLDDILFGKEEEKKEYKQDRIMLDEEIPGLNPRSPLPRFRKVSLQELMSALGKAINTENRRIKKVVVARQYEMEANVAMPKQRINLKDRISAVYAKVRGVFENREERLAFSEISGMSNTERIATFVPLLHLDAQHKVFLEQEKTFDEIWIWLKNVYDKKYANELAAMRKEVEQEIEEMNKNMSKEEQERVDEIEEAFDNPIGNSLF
jgi:segregation and condensation protein A